MRPMRCLLLAVFAAAAWILPLCGAEKPIPALIPLPQQVTWTGETVRIAEVRLRLPGEDEKDRTFLEGRLRILLEHAGAKVLEGGTRPEEVEIRLEKGAVPNPRNSVEAYAFEAHPRGIHITAPSWAGLFYGVETLRQLLRTGSSGGAEAPGCSILDWPAFEIRGLMHDVGRNFQSIPFLEKQMEVLASYKLNTFHMHLTDRPGWRVESRKHPELNAPSSYRSTRKPGKFYTEAELREFVHFCRLRHITVIPEMDIPGHSEYFPKAFGFDMQTPEGMAVLKDEIDAWCGVFEGPFFHLGSDEVRIRMKALIPEMTAEVRRHGREVVIWRPGGPLPDDQVITQLWGRRSVPVEGVRFIDSRANYLNHLDPLAGIVHLFFQQPCRRPQGDAMALGGVLCYWPDTRVEREEDGLRIAPFYPALLAYGERLWRGREKDRPEYWAKLPPKGTPEFEAFEAFEERLIAHRDRFFGEMPFPYVKQTGICWRLIGPFDHQGRPDRAFPPEEEIRDAYTLDGKTYRWREEPAWGGTVHLNHFFGFPGHLPPAKSGTVYALTYLHAEREMDAHMWINFNTLSLSGGRPGAGNPPQGRWSWLLGKIWLNGEPVPPPHWDHPGLHGGAGMETAITDETYIHRPPVPVHFRKGWNTILVKAPHGEWKGRRSRKWCFTAVPVKWDGRHAVELPGVTFALRPGKGR